MESSSSQPSQLSHHRLCACVFLFVLGLCALLLFLHSFYSQSNFVLTPLQPVFKGAQDFDQVNSEPKKWSKFSHSNNYQSVDSPSSSYRGVTLGSLLKGVNLNDLTFERVELARDSNGRIVEVGRPSSQVTHYNPTGFTRTRRRRSADEPSIAEMWSGKHKRGRTETEAEAEEDDSNKQHPHKTEDTHNTPIKHRHDNFMPKHAHHQQSTHNHRTYRHYFNSQPIDSDSLHSYPHSQHQPEPQSESESKPESEGESGCGCDSSSQSDSESASESSSQSGCGCESKIETESESKFSSGCGCESKDESSSDCACDLKTDNSSDSKSSLTCDCDTESKSETESDCSCESAAALHVSNDNSKDESGVESFEQKMGEDGQMIEVRKASTPEQMEHHTPNSKSHWSSGTEFNAKSENVLSNDENPSSTHWQTLGELLEQAGEKPEDLTMVSVKRQIGPDGRVIEVREPLTAEEMQKPNPNGYIELVNKNSQTQTHNVQPTASSFNVNTQRKHKSLQQPELTQPQQQPKRQQTDSDSSSSSVSAVSPADKDSHKQFFIESVERKVTPDGEVIEFATPLTFEEMKKPNPNGYWRTGRKVNESVRRKLDEIKVNPTMLQQSAAQQLATTPLAARDLYNGRIIQLTPFQDKAKSPVSTVSDLARSHNQHDDEAAATQFSNPHSTQHLLSKQQRDSDLFDGGNQFRVRLEDDKHQSQLLKHSHSLSSALNSQVDSEAGPSAAIDGALNKARPSPSA